MVAQNAPSASLKKVFGKWLVINLSKAISFTTKEILHKELDKR